MPLDPDDVCRLEDMHDYGTRVVAMVQSMTLDQFMADDRTLLAVCYDVQVVGEAAWKVSDRAKRECSTIPWPLIAGMRHRLVHDYGRTDESVVFQVATTHMPALLVQIAAALAATRDQ